MYRLRRSDGGRELNARDFVTKVKGGKRGIRIWCVPRPVRICVECVLSCVMRDTRVEFDWKTSRGPKKIEKKK